MATGSDIVHAALWRLGVVSEDETASTATLTKAVDTMNRMAFGWKARGVDVEWATITSADDFPLDPEYEDHFVWILADTLTGDYPSVPMPNQSKVKDAWDVMRASFHTAPTSTIDSGILKLPSRNLTSWWFR